jgi:hypothetical protein
MRPMKILPLLKRSELDTTTPTSGSGDPVTDPAEFAAQQGQRMIVPGPRELFLDLDSTADVDYMKMAVDTLYVNGEPFVVKSLTPSKTAGHYHAIVVAPFDLTPEQRMLFQMMLGSDRKREIWGWLRYRKGYGVPTALFEAA